VFNNSRTQRAFPTASYLTTDTKQDRDDDRAPVVQISIMRNGIVACSHASGSKSGMLEHVCDLAYTLQHRNMMICLQPLPKSWPRNAICCQNSPSTQAEIMYIHQPKMVLGPEGSHNPLSKGMSNDK